MKTRLWIFIALLSILVMACSDQSRQTHTITGKALFNGTMDPMDDILVGIYQDNGQDGLKADIIATNQLTSATGDFSFEIQPFKNEEASEIILSSSVTTQNNLLFSSQSLSLPIIFASIDPALVMESDTYVEDIIGSQFGFLEIELKGNTDLFVDDELEINISGDGYAYRTPFQIGDNLDQKFRYPVKAGEWTTIEWKSTISGIEKTGLDSIFCRNRNTSNFWIQL